jgi:hypothetical protein
MPIKCPKCGADSIAIMENSAGYLFCRMCLNQLCLKQFFVTASGGIVYLNGDLLDPKPET